jgi:teichuronic acid exporter
LTSLKHKTISGILWSSVDNISSQGIAFIVGVILARLLDPKEFGLIGMITIFISVSQTFINSAFSEALVRKNDCTQADYSTVFYYNFLIGLLLFSLLYITSPAISNFFREPALKNIVRVLSLVLILNSLTVIQNTILKKHVDFKLLARISILSSGVSGIFAVILAYKGFGVWSLVALTLIREGLRSLFLWLWNRWRPALIFSKKSFFELFGFGSKLLLSGLLDAIYNNIYFPIIGKFFSATELGFYTRANSFSSVPSTSISSVVTRVTYPVLAQLQDNKVLLREAYRRIIKSVMLITFPVMLGLAAVSEPTVLALIGEKWRPSITYLQLLCFASVFYPLHALNLEILEVIGRSDLFLKLEIIKKVLAIPVVIFGVIFGIKAMITSMIGYSLVAYYINSYWSGKFIDYSMKQQIKDIMPSFLLAVVMAFLIFLMGNVLDTSYLVKLFLEVSLGIMFYIGSCECIKMPDYLYLKQIVVENVFKRK